MKKSNIYGIGFFCLIVICFVPIPPDPPPSPYSFPHSYTINLNGGTVTGGYVWWTHIDDGNTFDIRAHWYWFFSFFF